jgi:hypothetical protein
VRKNVKSAVFSISRVGHELGSESGISKFLKNLKFRYNILEISMNIFQLLDLENKKSDFNQLIRARCMGLIHCGVRRFFFVEASE